MAFGVWCCRDPFCSSFWRDCDDSRENDCSTYVYIRMLLSTPFETYITETRKFTEPVYRRAVNRSIEKIPKCTHIANAFFGFIYFICCFFFLSRLVFNSLWFNYWIKWKLHRFRHNFIFTPFVHSTYHRLKAIENIIMLVVAFIVAYFGIFNEYAALLSFSFRFVLFILLMSFSSSAIRSCGIYRYRHAWMIQTQHKWHNCVLSCIGYLEKRVYVYFCEKSPFS